MEESLCSVCGGKSGKTIICVCITDYRLSRTAMVFQALDDICYKFDLSKPIWLDANISEFQRVSKTRFTQDSFIETIPFDFLELQVIEEP